MNRPIAIAVLVLTALAATMNALVPSTVNAEQLPQLPPSACFFFTINGIQILPSSCNRHANDIKIDFAPLLGQPCFIQFTLNGGLLGNPEPCPTAANDIEVFWKVTGAGPVITSCTWTIDEQPISAPCTLPASAAANDFHFFATGGITQVFWTHNGKPISPVILPPPGANDVDFFFI